jgi:predicted ATP-binding protein involved in virulence
MFDINKGLKLKEVIIEEYKLFQDFKINFVDSQDNPLPLIVIAGINGTGKTTLLEAIYSFRKRCFTKLDKIFMSALDNGEERACIKELKLSVSNEFGELPTQTVLDYSENKIVYLSANENLQNIKEYLPKYLFQKIFNERADVEETYKSVREYINSIFINLNIKIEFDSRDGDGNIFFKNKKGKVFSIDDISTGEKTLLSKILYLYIEKIKNKVILIDEPELSLHPKWQNQVLKLYEKFAKENNCQIIIATHSPHIIGSAKNEWIRVLTTNEKNEIKVVDKNLYAHGRDINSILFDVMGEARYRPLKEFDEKIDYLYHYIDNQEFDKAKEKLEELEKDYGKNDRVILEAKMTIDMLSNQD